MAGTIGDVIQLTLVQSYAGQEMLNVFYYRLQDVGTVGYLDGLVSEFQTRVLAYLAPAQNTSVGYVKIVAQNLFNFDISIDTTLSPSQGSKPAAGDQTASLIAAGIYLQPENRRVRRGYKFISGFHEGDLNGNFFTTAYVNTLQQFANRLTLTIAPGLGADNFIPVIVKRNLVNGVYKLPDNQLSLGDNWARVIGATVDSRITTMRSRKPRN
jgi:hypothetical protein